MNELQTVPGISVSLVPERIGQLSANLGRERLIVQAVVVGGVCFPASGRFQKGYPRSETPRQLGQRAMAIVVRGNQFVGVVNIKDDPGAEHQQPDPHTRANNGTKNQ